MTNSFQDEALTEWSHEDQAKHYIGQSLPYPSVKDIKFAGVETSPGVSIFPARADHTHDTRARFCGMSGTSPRPQSCPPGATWINNLTAPWGTENWLHPGSKQLVDIPQEGNYDINLMYTIVRSTGNFPANTFYRISYAFYNGTQVGSPDVGGLVVGTNQFSRSIKTFSYFGSVDPTTNFQFYYYNYDSVNHDFYVDQLELYRKCSTLGANQ